MSNPIVSVLFDNTINTAHKKILVLSLVNNCANSIGYISRFIQDCKENFVKVQFCFFSNNNTDNTLSLLDNLSDKFPGLVSIIKYQDEHITIDNRIDKFVEYRNLLFHESIKKFGTDFDYVIVFDSDMNSVIPIGSIVDSLKVIEPKWSCISGNHCYQNSSYYYDELALRLENDPIDIAEKFVDFYTYYGLSEKWITTLRIVDNWLKVKSAFGGVSIYHMDELVDINTKFQKLYDTSEFPPFTAEHICLNSKLKNAVLINPNTRYNNSVSLENKMYGGPITFVPRDAGFFSVFNFYIGCLTLGIRAYPYFNKQMFLKINDKNEHFCYWTDNENCWFDYFEPLSFYPEDTTHTTDEYKTFFVNNGDMAPTEFRIPKDTHNLINDKTKFEQWRHNTHKIYSRYIKYTDAIKQKVDNFWGANIDSTKKTIGVHYRHPSHFIESGKVYLEQYFDVIDQMIKNNPEIQIFLATDSNFGIYAFIEKYGNRVKYVPNIDRLSMPEFLQWCFSLADGTPDHVGFINNKGYELQHKRVHNDNNKQMTIDLLTEVLCLCKCDSFVHTTSNVALAISYMNPSLDMISL